MNKERLSINNFPDLTVVMWQNQEVNSGSLTLDILLGVTVEGGDKFFAEIKGQDESKMIVAVFKVSFVNTSFFPQMLIDVGYGRGSTSNKILI